jgi:hypothetical protein
LFEIAENVYYATIDWNEHPAYIGEERLSVAMPSKTLTEDGKVEEEDKFYSWLQGYFPNAKEMRWSEEFSRGVERIRDSLVFMEDMDKDMSSRWNQIKYEQGRDPETYMMDQIVFEQDPNRIASLVGMYNLTPGRAGSTQKKIMSYYKNMMNSWLVSIDPETDRPRTMAGFMEQFVTGSPLLGSKQAI